MASDDRLLPARKLRLRDFPALVSARREAAARRPLFTEPDLTYLFWEATLRCNLRCAHCGSRCEARSPVGELDAAQVVRIFGEIAQDFDARRVFVSITGGEPLLRADLADVVAGFTALGFRSCVVTNGTLLTAATAARLYDAGMRTVTVSVDGTRDEHDAVRGPGTHARALGALETARNAGFDVVEAVTCARPANLPSLHALEREVRAHGANLWRIITVDRMGRGSDDDARGLWLAPAEVRVLLDFVAARRRVFDFERDDFDVRFSCGGFLGVRRERAVRPSNGQCFAGIAIGAVLCDGQVSACPSLPRSWAQGSALGERFSTIWHRRFERHRDLRWRREGPCSDCSWFSVCLGGGLHERLAQPDDFCWLDRQDAP